MIIKVLAENTSSSESLGSEHGLSLYIETEKHKLLFDTGASGLFAANAEKLGVDLSEADTVVISHGHYDHGGGLKTFLDINKKAAVYVHNKVFGKYFSQKPGNIKAYIGLDETLISSNRFVFCGNNYVLDDELELFSGVTPKRLVPSGNSNLYMKIGEDFLLDSFAHEQNLIINQGGKTLLIAGCAHNGIVNIIDCFAAQKGKFPDYIIGGFHLYSQGRKTSEKPETVAKIGEILLGTHSQYYTCHCTGIEAYEHLKSVMGNKIGYLSTGDKLTI